MREQLGTSSLKEGTAAQLESKYRENRATGRKVRPSTALRKEEMAVRL
jgi:hypothetical protein